MAIGINAIEISSRPLMEHLESDDIQTWLIDLISKNWETVAAGGLFFVLIGTDVVAISRDVLADGEVDLRDKEDLAALGRGFLRIVGSLAGATALKFALEKNPVATLSTLAAGVIAAVGISKTVELARNVPKAGDKKSRLSALGGAAVIAVATGGIVGTLELGAFQIDPEALMIANIGLAAVAVTRPSQFINLVEKTRNFIGGK